ncbi:MAG: hypothetical protein ACAI35_10950 [Candidatus Methylacidiphilales bacterium]
MPPLLDAAAARAAGPLFDAPDKDYGNHPLGKLGGRQVVADAGGRPRASEHGKWDGFTRGLSNLWARTKECFMSTPDAAASKYNRAQKEFSRQFDNLLGELNTGAPNMDRVFKRLEQMGEKAQDMLKHNPDADITSLMQARAAKNLSLLAHAGTPGDGDALKGHLRNLNLDGLHRDLAVDHARRGNDLLEALGEIGDIQPQEVHEGLNRVFEALHAIKGQVLAGEMSDPSRASDHDLAAMMGDGGDAAMRENVQAGDSSEGIIRLAELRHEARTEGEKRGSEDRAVKVDAPMAKVVQDIRAGKPDGECVKDFLKLRAPAGQHMDKMNTLGLMQPMAPQVPPVTLEMQSQMNQRAVMLDSIARMPADDQRLLFSKLPADQLKMLLAAREVQLPGGASAEQVAGAKALIHAERDSRLAALATRMGEVREGLQEGGVPINLTQLIELEAQYNEAVLLGGDLGAVNAQKDQIGERLGLVLTPERHAPDGVPAQQIVPLVKALTTFGAGHATENGALARALVERAATPQREARLDGPLRALAIAMRDEPDAAVDNAEKFHNMLGGGAASHVTHLQSLGVTVAGLNILQARQAVLLDSVARLPAGTQASLIATIANADINELLSAPELVIPNGASTEQLAGLKELLRAERQRRMDTAMERMHEASEALQRQENVAANLILLSSDLKNAAKLGGDLSAFNVLKATILERVGQLDAGAIPMEGLPDADIKKVTSALVAMNGAGGALHGAVAAERTRRLGALEAPYMAHLGRGLEALSQGNIPDMLRHMREANTAEQALFGKYEAMGETIDILKVPIIREGALRAVLGGMTPPQLQALQRHAAGPRVTNLGHALTPNVQGGLIESRAVLGRVDAIPVTRALSGLADFIITAESMAREMGQAQGFEVTPGIGAVPVGGARLNPENIRDVGSAFGLDMGLY